MTKTIALARKYRPRLFSDVVGQESVVTTLRNAVKQNKFAQSYLFFGMRGTGKTTLARLLAKAMNCSNPLKKGEPCNGCRSCKGIDTGNSLDFMEIDAASHRGIEEIRQINESVVYAPGEGKYKIYLIDEVHMLTIQAFNALLKTLEEPPAHVKFFFATTEREKVPVTIVSRCQRFGLLPVSPQFMVENLQKIAVEENIVIDREALRQIAKLSEGALRDAQFLLEQLFTFTKGKITVSDVYEVFGTLPSDLFFALDQAMLDQNWKQPFLLTEKVFSEGKDPFHFLSLLIEHVRMLLLTHLEIGCEESPMDCSDEEEKKYRHYGKNVSKGQCIHLLDFLMQEREKCKQALSSRVYIEYILLYYVRSRQMVPVEDLIDRLSDLEEKLSHSSSLQKREEKEKKIGQGSSSVPAQKEEGKKKLQSQQKEKREEKESALLPSSVAPSPLPENQQKQREETILQFAAIELEGKVEREQRGL